ncbi:MAG: WbqC family protein [Rickettsiales bacterium]|nr:WbqC family protein [Rickettsiales bacterium]
MKLAIMQPYFLPYIGYFQLIGAADAFVIYDTIKYTKKGWINRNRMLLNGTDAMFSLPLKKASDALDVVERELATDFDREALLNQWKGAYAKAPHFAHIYPLLEGIMRVDEQNLFRFIHHAVLRICAYLGITTPIHIASHIPIDHALRGQEKVLALAQAMGATTYINSMGGMALYEAQAFAARGVDLKFLRPKPLEYPQFGASFVPWLSILDVLMFNPREVVAGWAHQHYEVISP